MNISLLHDFAIDFVEQKYNFRPLKMNLLEEGTRVNWRAIGPEYDVVVRCDSKRPLSQAVLDTTYMNLAGEVGVSVPRGPYCFGVYEGAVLSARPYLEGYTFSSKIVSPKSYFVVGQQLAQINSIVSEFNRGYIYSFVYTHDNEQWVNIIKYAFDSALTAYSDQAKRLAEFITKNSHFQLASGFIECLIHGDCKPSNLLVTPSDIVVILDWDKSCLGSWLFDLSTAIFHAACYNGKKVRMSYVQALLEGYKHASNHKRREFVFLKQSIPLMAAAFLLTDITYFAINQSKQGEDEYDPRRFEYFNNYCLPAYSLFKKNEKGIVATVNNLLV